MKRFLVAIGGALAACALIAPGAARAQTTRSCPDVSFTHSTTFFKYVGIRVTDIGCLPASRLLVKAGKTNKNPAGWTFGDTEAKYDSTTGTTVCGFDYKRGSQRIVFHTTNTGQGC